MNKKQRAAVVELLRCAADQNNLVMTGYRTGYVDGINPCDPVYSLACDALAAVSHATSAWYYARPRKHLLEAAQRVEDGEWP